MGISDFSLEGKKAVVVGGRKGLGKAYALTFAEAGADVAVADIEVADGMLDSVAEKIKRFGRRCLTAQVDISKKADIDEFVKKVMAEFGTIDIWANVAVRYHLSSGLLELGEQDWDILTDTNLKGYWLACQAVAPIMMERKKGSIINMTSQAGLRAFNIRGWHGNYAITKAGIVMLTKQFALNLAQYNVRVNAIALSQVRPDPMPTEPEALERANKFLERAKAGIPLGRIAEPVEIANGALYLASDASSFVTGHVLVIDGGSIA